MSCRNFVGVIEDRTVSGGSDPLQQTGVQNMTTTQTSTESITVRGSSNVRVTTTDIQAALALQAGLQLAIAIVLSVATGSAAAGQDIAQDLTQRITTTQANTQNILIENSTAVTVATADIDLTANIQALLQVLLELVARLGL